MNTTSRPEAAHRARHRATERYALEQMATASIAVIGDKTARDAEQDVMRSDNTRDRLKRQELDHVAAVLLTEGGRMTEQAAYVELRNEIGRDRFRRALSTGRALGWWTYEQDPDRTERVVVTPAFLETFGGRSPLAPKGGLR